jgi:hypothetical protein
MFLRIFDRRRLVGHNTRETMTTLCRWLNRIGVQEGKSTK